MSRAKKFFVVAVLAFLGFGTPQTATAQTMGYHGGYLIQHPRVFISYWNWPGASSDPGSIRPWLEGLLGHLGGTKYMGLVSQYSTLNYTIHNDLPVGAVATWNDTTVWPFDDPTTATNRHPNSDDVAAAVLRAAQHFGTTQDDIIFLMTGSNRTYWLDPSACGYHARAQASPTAPYVFFADIPYPSDTQNPPRWGNGICSMGTEPGQTTSVVSYHELAETITDPRGGSGWRDVGLPPQIFKTDPKPGQEIGDYSTGLVRMVRLDESDRLYQIQALVSSVWGGPGRFYFANKGPIGNDPMMRAYWTDTQSVLRGVDLLYTSGNVVPDSLSSPFNSAPGASWLTNDVVDVFAFQERRIVKTENYLSGGPASVEDWGEAEPQWDFAYSPDAATMGWNRGAVAATEVANYCTGIACTKVRYRERGPKDWEDWETLPIPTTGIGSGPGAVGWGPGLPVTTGGNYFWGFNPVFLAVLDQSTPPHVLVAEHDDTGYAWQWADYGSPPHANLIGDPDMSSFDTGEYDVWARDDKGQLWQLSVDLRSGSQVTGWTNRGMPIDPTSGERMAIDGDVAATTTGDASVMVAATVLGNQIIFGGIDSGGGWGWGVAQSYTHDGHGWDLTCR